MSWYWGKKTHQPLPHNTIKFNLEWIIHLNIKAKCNKLLDKTQEKNLCNLTAYKDLLAKTHIT